MAQSTKSATAEHETAAHSEHAAHAHQSHGKAEQHEGQPRDAKIAGGREQMRNSPFMAKLMDDLDNGVDVGHYGRLTYAMVARYFVEPKDIADLLAGQPDQDEAKASAMVQQVVHRGYSPPRRERLMEWQAKQHYQMVDPEDPDSGNLYRDLEFPNALYDHISEYHEEQVESHGIEG